MFILFLEWNRMEWNRMEYYRIDMEYYRMEYYYLALKRKEILTHAIIQMNLEVIMLSEITQSQKDKYHMFPLT